MSYRVGLRHIIRVSRRRGVLPPAWSYFDVMGSIWMLEIGWYFDAVASVAIFVGTEAPSGWSGWYFNR